MNLASQRNAYDPVHTQISFLKYAVGEAFYDQPEQPQLYIHQMELDCLRTGILFYSSWTGGPSLDEYAEELV